jgi:ferredoxin
VLDVNPFPAITGRTCPHPCETPCNRKAYGGGISVRQIERQVGDHKLLYGIRPDLPRTTFERVHVVGAGPAGLSAAVALRRLGHPVTVHGTAPRRSGVLACGGAEDGLPTDVVRAEFAWVAGLGVDFEPEGRHTREEIEAMGPTIVAMVPPAAAKKGGAPVAESAPLPDGWGDLVGEAGAAGRRPRGRGAGCGDPAGDRHRRLRPTLHAERTGGHAPADPLATQGASPEVAKFKSLHMASFHREAPVPCEVLDGEYRLLSSAGVEYGLTRVGATAEAARCFKCGTCTDCDTCFHVCPDVAISKAGGGYVIDLAHLQGLRRVRRGARGRPSNSGRAHEPAPTHEPGPRDGALGPPAPGAPHLPATSRTMILTGNQAAAWARTWRTQVVSAYPIAADDDHRDARRPDDEGDVALEVRERRVRALRDERVHRLLDHRRPRLHGDVRAGPRAHARTAPLGVGLAAPDRHGGREPRDGAGVEHLDGQNDSLSQRDRLGADLLLSAQDVLDTVLRGVQGRRALNVPVMVVEDAFVCRTAEAVEVPTPRLVDRFLSPRKASFKLDVEKPASFGGLLSPDWYQEVREDLHRSLLAVEGEMEKAGGEWERLSGRAYDAIQTWNMEGAKIALVTSGTVSSTALDFIESPFARREGGARPDAALPALPSARARAILAGIPKVAVIDRNCSYGAHGIWFQELKSALYGFPTPNVRRSTAT